MVKRAGDQLGLLPDQRDLVVQFGQIMSADLGAEPVLQRSDDPAPVGVVLRVGGGDQEHVQGQPQRIAADLDVSLFQHVEQRDLDALGQVGQLVQPEDATVGPRHQSVVHGLRVAEGTALSDLDRVHVADQVADAGVRRSELLGVTVIPMPPGDRQFLTELGGQCPAPDADRRVRVVVDLTIGDLGTPLVQQLDQGPHQPGLPLAALAEQDEIMTRQQRGLQLRQHGVVETDDPGEGRLAAAESGQQIRTQFLGNGLGLVAAGTKLAEGGELAEGGGRHVPTLRPGVRPSTTNRWLAERSSGTGWPAAEARCTTPPPG